MSERSEEREDFCFACSEVVSESELRLTCINCEYPYHLGKCSGVSEATFRAKKDNYKKTWSCATCRVTKQRVSQGDQSCRNKKECDTGVAAMLTSISQKLDTLLPLRGQMSDLEKSVKYLSSKYDDILRHMSQQDKDIKQLTKRVEHIEQSAAEAEITKLKADVNALEWRSRRQNLEVHGVPATANEDLMAKVNEVANRLEVPELTQSDVVTVHRLPSKPDKTPGIIVRFANQGTRDKWLEGRRKLTRGQNSVYLQENLTTSDKALLWMTKEWAKANGYRYVWFRSGKVFIRKGEGEQALVIRSKSDLDKITG